MTLGVMAMVNWNDVWFNKGVVDMSIVKCNNFSTNKLVLKEHMPMLMVTFIVCQGHAGEPWIMFPCAGIIIKNITFKQYIW